MALAIMRRSILVVTEARLTIRNELGQTRHEGALGPAMSGPASGSRDEIAHLLERLFTRRADDVPDELCDRAQRKLLPHRRALHTHQPGVRRKLSREGRDERRLPDAELASDDGGT